MKDLGLEGSNWQEQLYDLCRRAFLIERERYGNRLSPLALRNSVLDNVFAMIRVFPLFGRLYIPDFNNRMCQEAGEIIRKAATDVFEIEFPVEEHNH